MSSGFAWVSSGFVRVSSGFVRVSRGFVRVSVECIKINRILASKKSRRLTKKENDENNTRKTEVKIGVIK